MTEMQMNGRNENESHEKHEKEEGNAELIVRTSVSRLNETNMYFVENRSSNTAVLIDPSDEGAAEAVLETEKLKLDYIFLTHEHYDHIAALNQIRRRYDVPVVSSEICSRKIRDPGANLSKFFPLVLEFQKEKEPERKTDFFIEPYSAQAADIRFDESLVLDWHGCRIELRESPGHSAGSILIKVGKEILFSGDTLSLDYELITGFPGGSRRAYEQKTKPLLRRIDGNCRVYPGHGRCFLMRDFPDID